MAEDSFPLLAESRHDRESNRDERGRDGHPGLQGGAGMDHSSDWRGVVLITAAVVVVVVAVVFEIVWLRIEK